jgi:hypothetical protein
VVEGAKSASISLLTIVLAFLLDLVATRFVVGSRNLSLTDWAFTYGVFNLQYELILVSFGLLLTAHFGLAADDRGRLSSAWVIVFTSLILALSFNAYGLSRQTGLQS